MSTFAYDLSDFELIKAFREACIRSRSPFDEQVYDPIGNHQAQEWTRTTDYLEGVLHARLAGEVPPVRPGAIVRFKKQPQLFNYELRRDLQQMFVVERVIYVRHDHFMASKGQKWHIILCNMDTSPFKSLNWEDFEIVASDPMTVATQPA